MKKNCLFLLLTLITTQLAAQTGGPGQPEFMQFQQAGTSDLVNPASGTFSYQIPLFSIGGYPMNLTYQSGIMMEDVASMAGLGWTANAGCINRTMRFLPDDFQGDMVIKEYSVAPNITIGGKFGADLEFAGISKKITNGALNGTTQGAGLALSAELGVFYNTYKGWGRERAISANVSYSLTKSKEGTGPSASLGLGSNVNSQSGVDRYISPNLGLKFKSGSDMLNISLGHTWSVNSNEGLKKSLNTSMSMVSETGKKCKGKQDKGTGVGTSDDSYSTSLMGFSHNSYLNNSFQPRIDYPYVNESGTYSGTVGWDAYYVDPSLRITGYYSSQRLATTKQEFPAFGTMYEFATMPARAMLDFNREKEMPYLFGESDILPIPFRTPDVFNLSAQGLSMSFSAFRNDIGAVGDPSGMNLSSGNNIGAEVGLGQAFKAGANLGTNVTTQRTGKLSPSFFGALPEQSLQGDEPYRQWYFKNLGEINKFNPTTFDNMGQHSPVQFDIVGASTAASCFIGGKAILDNVQNTALPVRQSNIEYLTASEADAAAFWKKLTYYEFGNPDVMQQSMRCGDKMPYRRGHHLSKITVTQPDGMTYEFGLPVYNLSQKEVSFNVSKRTTDCAKNQVRYVSDGDNPDNSVRNKRGKDNFFEATTTPAYATQFLITAVLGSDYRDLTGDGISEDDPGNYVKFDYYKEKKDYQWRTPVEEDMATFNAGLRSDPLDDRGSYVYGVKELWYLKTIESKTEIAEFHYSPRKDGYGVAGENGGIDKQQILRQLDSVVVFSLPDRKSNGNQATPVKTIHFYYNNTLCKGINNGWDNQTGKSTLESVAITYGRSQKGKLSPYKFEYGVMAKGGIMNPDYDIRGVNRWGYYQPNPNNVYSDCNFVNTTNNPNSPMSNIDYPYALQDKTLMDKYAHAWNLTGITIPGGGELSVQYEAHDHGCVQNKTAGQMFKVSAITAAFPGLTAGNELYSLEMEPAFTKNRIHFALSKPIDNGNDADNKKELAQDYIKDIQNGYLYYKFYVRLGSFLPPIPSLYEYISGYAKIIDFGVDADHLHGYVDIEEVQLDDEKGENGICPSILKTALQFMRINRTNLVYQNTLTEDPKTLLEFVNALQSAKDQMDNQAAAFKNGINRYCKMMQYCRFVDLQKSFIRLYSPDQFKLAGGSRVSDITIDDNWDEMIGNTDMGKSYSTHYDYTTEVTDLVHGGKKTISSGVADYEPLVGGDEISLKQPIFYADVKKKAPDTEYYVEEPVNESLFPAPQITYSKVTETSNPTTLTDVAKTGKIIHEFYTAQDCPVKVSRTTIDSERDKTNYNPVHNPFLAIDAQHDYAMVSQGFSIETNNMSGMPKATWVYNENGDRISGEVTEYFPFNDHLTTIDRNGVINRNTALGLSVLYTVDGRDSYDQTVSSTFKANFNGAFFGPFLIPIIVPLFSEMTEEKQFQSLVTNKIIQRNGIVKSKTVYSQSAAITTENLAFDEVTGEALLTKTTNEFNDSLYSFKYPAWWKYDGMGPSYQNSKLLIRASNVEDAKKFLRLGDELRAVINGQGRIWVKDPTSKTFMKDDGTDATLGSKQYIVYNSGAKNLLSSPMGQVVTWKWDPIRHGDKINFAGDSVVLNSSAIEYYDSAVAYCDTCDVLRNRLGKNDYLSGKLGNWKPKRTWFHLADRTFTNQADGKSNLRKDGLFRTYNDFWLPPATASAGWTIDPKHWEWKEQVNRTDTDGQTIETEDAIGRRTANLLGYRNNLVIAQAVNAGYGETYFDGFEDYVYSFCPASRLGDGVGEYGGNNFEMKRVRLAGGGIHITDDYSHTGKYALAVGTGLSFTIYPPKPCGGSPSTNSGNTWNTSDNGFTWGPGTPTVTSGTGTTTVTGATSGTGTVPVTLPAPLPTVPTTPPCIECIGGFNPLKAKDYIFSAWVKVNSTPPVVNCADASVLIEAEGKPNVTLYPSGPMSDEWQRIEGKFTTSNSSNNVTVTLRPGLFATYYDDLRIFPADGNMASYVYDDVKLKLTYTLDENNYFTKYEYNNQGELIRIKRETEDGIVTQKEGSSSIVKQ